MQNLEKKVQEVLPLRKKRGKEKKKQVKLKCTAALWKENEKQES